MRAARFVLRAVTTYGLVVGLLGPQPASGQVEASTRAANAGDATAPAVSDDEIQRLVDRLFFPKKPDDDEELRLQTIGRRTTPFLVKALGNSDKVTAKFGEDERVFSEPLHRICDAVSRENLPEIVGSLAKYSDHHESGIRWNAARVLGRLGSKECIGPVLKALEDKDSFVRDGARRGILTAIEEKKCVDEVRVAVFPVLEKQLRKRDADGDGDLPKLMLELDRVRALTILLSAEILSVDNRQACYALAALNDAKVKIPHERLLPYLQAAKPLSKNDTHDYAYCEALKAYGRNPDANAAATLRAELSTRNPFVPEGAAEGLAILFGVEDAEQFVVKLHEKVGFEKLSEAQRRYYAVWSFERHLYSGGFRQYFESSEGKHWKECSGGLEAMWGVKKSEIFRRVLAVFEPGTPDADDAKRRAQVAAFSAAQLQSLADLRLEYDNCGEDIYTRLAVYAADHSKDFRK